MAASAQQGKGRGADPDATVGPRTRRDAGAAQYVTGLTLLWHPDATRVGERAILFEPGDVRRRAVSRDEPIFRPARGGAGRTLGARTVSREGIELTIAAGGDVRIERAGRIDLLVDGGAVAFPHHVPSAALSEGVVLLLGDAVALMLHRFTPIERATEDHGIIGHSAAICRVRELIESVADLDKPVLLRGESGVGKELVARALHRASRRRDRPLVCVNMSVLSESTAQSALFGHVRGAFTGAGSSHAGYFQQADRGTLLLDELADTPLPVQPFLLRAVQDGSIQPLGSDAARRVDVRLVAATDSDLEAAIERGTFRHQLFERLAAFEIEIPPLRRRRDDVGRLFAHFLQQELEAMGAGARLAPPRGDGRGWVEASIVARAALADWPGNVRQLQRFVGRAAVLSRGKDALVLDDKLEAMLQPGRREPAQDAGGSAGDPGTSAAPIPDEVIRETLRRHDFSINPVARELGVAPTSLKRRLEKLPGFRFARDLQSQEIAEAMRACQGDVGAAAARLQVSRKGLIDRMRLLDTDVEA